MKKYRVREYSPAWWIPRIGAGLGIIAGAYCWILLAHAFFGG